MVIATLANFRHCFLHNQVSDLDRAERLLTHDHNRFHYYQAPVHRSAQTPISPKTPKNSTNTQALKEVPGLLWTRRTKGTSGSWNDDGGLSDRRLH
jgi:hypothetical protein